MAWLTDLWRTTQLSDILDMAFMAGLVYILLIWFKRTKAAFVARGMVIFVLAYAVALQVEMRMTTWMFQGIFAVALFALVVIFQEELRSFFERLAVWSLRRSASPLAPPQIEVLVRVLAQFATSRTGAIIALKGHDPLERHIDGGEDLEGQLSAPLLESLFDPHSKGHDGAVIMEGDHIHQFGVHLPLSKDFRQLQGKGTRHASALGLSELTDAMCLVVSEESGTISIAQGGSLRATSDLNQLESEILKFLKELRPTHVRGAWYGFLRRNALEKSLAVLIAVTLWLVLIQGFNRSRAEMVVPVTTDTADEQWHATRPSPAMVTVTLRGLKRDLERIERQGLRAEVHVEDASAGRRTVAIDRDDLQLPRRVQLSHVDPPRVTFHLKRRVVARAPEATPSPVTTPLERVKNE